MRSVYAPQTSNGEKRPTERLRPFLTQILDHFAPDRPMTADEIEVAGRRLKKALMERMLGAELSHHWAIRRAASSRTRPPIIATAPVRSAC